ncbi:phosphatidylinositol 4,5-bisphosphate 3-kinase catalytic subunit delta isoform [Leptopilina heterotoma]|uniref:phosphatidylinositol 4,5-bisphosphate 3-kinase catalytic subunit delta isoform n=1 Tax=Leptopilina heterotoma TaxID=63436 RepID=UPI001CA7EA6C|nr:phosphatidylinositol 4,5-bisphosphate 3-kinase catalytic subunit delta isoform [Leptopilina heterotoma]
MVHTPSAYTYNFWTKTPTEVVELTCLMPNGVLIPLETNRNTTLTEIKEDLWDEASKYPLHGTLRDAPSYVFSCINANAEAEELRDESRRLCDIKPFCSVLKVIEREEVKGDRNLDSQIGLLIGKGLHEFAALKNSEVNDFRWKMRVLGDEIALGRQKKSWIEKVEHQYPLRLANCSILPQHIESRLNDGNIVLLTKFENTETTFSFQISHSTTPHQLLVQILNKRANTLMSRGERPGDFILKVCGQEEYLIGEYPVIQFIYIQESLSRDTTPVLLVLSRENVILANETAFDNPEADTLKRTRPSSSTLTLRRKGKLISVWKIEDQFSFTVNGISRLNCDAAHRTVEIGLQAGLFHGGKSLCESRKTKETVVNLDGSCEWEETLKFDIKVRDIPRMARLCFVLYEISKTAKGLKSRRLVKDSKQEYFINPLCWTNTTIYDFKSQLKTGAMTLYTWTYAEDMQNEDLLHPLGTVVSNPHIDRAAALMLTFPNYGKDKSVLYPSPDKMVEYAAKLQESSEESLEEEPSQDTDANTLQQLEQLRALADRDPLHELHEQERKTMWLLRHHCLRKIPSLLAKLLHCVEWNDHREVAEATALIQQWPKLPVERALELLDYAYADQNVRSFAVRCLHDVSDEDLSLFLLQLVQALKHESYLSCDLTEFLLRRALNNQRIGHYLFWHLRSEMQVGSVSVRFGLILEAYCRGSQQHMRALFKQMECLDKLKTSMEQMKLRGKDRKAVLQAFQDFIQEPHCQDTLLNVLNPLDPVFKWNRIKIEKCRVMDSKRRPLWLVFENIDPFGDDIYLILKYGDDLRQDMLTLQMLRIMDKLWKREGLDLRMNPYGCISTENRMGLIEVVHNAETIANIQKVKGIFSATAAFKRGSLLAWLKDHNHTETELNKAIEEFTLSCAGYCVATYVLGIADRHSDNIMVKKTGQLFHVDFGHILGHFKEKFGFRRERVPFVLTNDFVHVINKGQTKKGQAVEFQRFQNYCEQAFLVLRRHGGLILSLFAMMISTGLPELSSEKDLNYLRDTLVLEMSESEAQKHFRSKFDEALCNSWKTSLNWASHNMSKNNKTT